MKPILVSLCFCLITKGFVDAKGDLKKICTEKTQAAVQDEFLEQGFKNGLYDVMIKKVDAVPTGMLKKSQPKETRIWNKKICITMEPPAGVAAGASGQAECRYNQTSLMSCSGFGNVGSVGGKSYGDVRIHLTDNSTYALLIGCLNNEKPFWSVVSPMKDFPAPMEELIMTKLDDLGFDRKDAAPKGDLARGNKLKKSEKCPKSDESSLPAAPVDTPVDTPELPEDLPAPGLGL